MLVSYNLLKTLVDIESLSPNEIANRLTFAGVEVENVYSLSNATNLIVGKVLEAEAIPDTHLHLCKVDLGNKHGIKQIICGAKNVRPNLKVIVAMPGAKLPGGEIKVSTIRGYESNGMLCSLLELGVDSKFVSDADLHGIHELDNSFLVGDESILTKLGLDDTILNLKLLANRPDLLSVFNVAKEVSTLFKRKLYPYIYSKEKGEKISFKVDSATSKCKQFATRIIKGIKVAPSPIELKKYLIAMGIRPINNIVDIGNLVMLLTGAPIHVYDLDKLPKHELIVKDDYEGDFVALDENHYSLNKGDLVVTSDNKVMCLAGVMGGLNSSDSFNTKNIAIEVANFNGANIRKTSIRLNLTSESSSRFTHGINPHQYEEVLQIASSLIKKYCGCNFVSEIISYDIIPHNPKKIITTSNEINGILGTNYNKEIIIKTLKDDYFLVEEGKNNELIVEAPSYRIDIDGINDLAEEVIRILGFDEVNNVLPNLKTKPGLLSLELKKRKEIERHLTSLGLYQVLSYVLVNKKRSNEFKYLNDSPSIKIKNPMTDDHEYVRSSLIPSLLDIVSFNLAHQNKDFGIFEISDINTLNSKSIYLGVSLVGNHKLQDELSKTPFSFYDLKGILEAIMEMLGINKNRYNLLPWNLGNEEMHKGRSALLYVNKKLVGYLGELHPNAYSNYEIKNNRVYVMEINLSSLFSLPIGEIKFKPLSRFPTVNRDLALLIDNKIDASNVINIIKRNGGPLLKKISIFDIYTNASLNSQKSLAVSLSLNRDDRTLNEQEIVETIDKIKAALLKENIRTR